MPVDGTKYHVLVIALGLLAVATAAGAGTRQTAMRPADDALQPREDGTYWLPISGMESVTLRFEPGDVPVELVAIRIDEENDSIVADLRYTGEKVVTAWQVKLASVDAAGHEDSALSVGTDWGPMGDPRLDPLPGYRVSGGPREVEGPIHPGDVRSVDLGSASGPDLEELVLSVALLVFEDTTWIGSQRLARQTLERRSMEAEEHARWLELIGRILESTSSERELTRALEDLVAEMEEIPDAPDRGTAAAVRHTLQDNLRALAQAAPGSPVSKREQLRDLALSERRHLEALSDHVPERLPEPKRPRKVSQPLIDEGPGGDPTGDPDLDCDCGGSISDNVVRSQSITCGPQRGWTVNEAWQIDCLNESGDIVKTRSGDLAAAGSCIDASMCFPATDCPPEFLGPDIYEEEGIRYWTRLAYDRTVYVGFCFTTARCERVYPYHALEKMCDCAPMPRPRCYYDGCPILIETGAGGFSLTSLDDGVEFDLSGNGVPNRVAWTVPGGDDAWLALDRNGNGRIDDATELFGDRTPQPATDQPHGFLALAVFDEVAHGGDGDGVISAADAVFSSLRLWLDHDHDGVSDLGELVPLPSADIAAIDLDYFRSERRDRYGNRFRYSAKVRLASGGQRLASDVFLQIE